LCILPGLKNTSPVPFNFKCFHHPESNLDRLSSASQYYMDVTHAQSRSGSPARIAREVQNGLDAWCTGGRINVGLSTNAPLAYYAATQAPDELPFIIRPWEITPKLADVDLTALLFIEKNLLQRLSLHGIHKVKHLTGLKRPDTYRLFGPGGVKLLDSLKGQEYFPQPGRADVDSRHISQQLSLPPNSSGNKLVLKYLKQAAFRLANRARMLDRFGNEIYMTVFQRNAGNINFSFKVSKPITGKSIYKNIEQKLPGRQLEKIVLAIELTMVDAEPESGQKALPLESPG
jgi:hypothetical protein